MLIKFADVTNLEAVAHTRQLRINISGSNEITNAENKKEENEIPFKKVQRSNLWGGNQRHVYSAGLNTDLRSNQFKQKRKSQ